MSYEQIKSAIKELAGQVLCLYRQFSPQLRVMRGDEGGMFAFCAQDICDDVVLEADSELNLTPARRRAAVYELLSSGLLADDKGNIPQSVKNKLLARLGYSGMSGRADLEELHRARCEEENRGFERQIAETAAEGCFATYEALVIPQSVKGGTRLLAFSAEKGGEGYGPFYYTLQADAEWKAGYVYTYDITIFYHGLEVEVSESIGWNAVNTGSGKVSLQDSYDEETKTYYVYTADGLDKWAEMARADLSVNCILMDDIDYEDKEWTAVGYGTASTSSYAGTFDGGGHTIRNIEIKVDAS